MERIIETLKHIFLILMLLTLTQCAFKTAPVAGLSDNIEGIKIGMSKEDAEKRLKEIGKFVRDEEKAQQVWSLSNNPNFGYAAIGYDKNNQVRYVTAIAKPRDGQPVFFKDIGDLTTAKLEVAGPNHRYTWEVAANGDVPGYSVIAQGASAESLSLYTLSKTRNPEQKNEEEDEEDK